MQKKNKWLGSNWSWIVFWLVIYFATHLIYLTNLPVFADEAIYIRWAQLMMDDLGRYLFFPLNDGKTPLFVWMLLPFQYLFKDPLFAGRLVTVLGGAVQVILTMQIVKELKGNKLAQGAAAFFVTFLPFWFMHHRMALMDGWLTVWITLASLAVIKLNQQKLSDKFIESKKSADSIVAGNLTDSILKLSWGEFTKIFTIDGVWIWIGGLALAAGLLTKVPAVIAIPSLLILVLLAPFRSKLELVARSLRVLIITCIGAVMLLSLKVSPAFPQLISRGSDFLYPVQEVVLAGAWQHTLINIPSYFWYYWIYLTPGIIVLLIASLLEPKLQRRTIVLILAGLAFIAPIVALGKVVYPRYLLPSLIYFTIAVSLTAAFYLERTKKKMSEVSMGKQFALVFVVIILLQQIVTPSLFAATFAWGDVSSYPFTNADKEQYLTKWSSGHGVREFVGLLQQESKAAKIFVASEGFFGTLPDGVLMYLHNQDVANIAVEGVGQPIAEIPPVLYEKQSEYDRLWLLVNSHRLAFDIPKEYLITEYCRPFDAPCLQVWDLTEVVADQEDI